ncbi:hypothetical protein DMC30DRAFT_352778 [Rhodotorula diobovata]|uniref:Uncharacterized protein n=1 Tax=Rhodotorula diobovata TaxID=5288 RepID=A0A5C5FU09_9BASI|nr:hypothetical protein DMC30DRAFT_352778 [Rhodotorula diobovata]
MLRTLRTPASHGRALPLLRHSLSTSPSSPLPPPPPPPPRPTRRLARSYEPYLARLRTEYPHADPPSLAVAFLALHELTALVPLVALFALLRHLALGTALVAWVLAESNADDAAEAGWRGTARTWLAEAEDKAERVGRRYGWFGWDKETRQQRQERRAQQGEHEDGEGKSERTADQLRVSGDVANAAAAYLAVKALLPLRILISLRLSPSLANVIARNFRSLRNRGKTYLSSRREPGVGVGVGVGAGGARDRGA